MMTSMRNAFVIRGRCTEQPRGWGRFSTSQENFPPDSSLQEDFVLKGHVYVR